MRGIIAAALGGGLVIVAAGIVGGARSGAPDPTTTPVAAPPQHATEMPAVPPRTASLLAHVPAEAFAVVGVDLGKARGSAAAMTAVTLLLRRTGLADRAEAIARAGGLDLLGAGTSLVIAGIPGAPGAAPQPLVIVRGPFDPSRIPTSAEVGVAGADLVIASAPVLARSLAATGSIVTTGSLVDALRTIDDNTLAFGAVRMIDEAKRGLAQLLPDLGAIEWIAGTLTASSSGLTLAGRATFPDPYVAARLAVAIGMGRKLAASQLPSAAVAAAVDKLAVTAMGATIRITATWSEADVAALHATL